MSLYPALSPTIASLPDYFSLVFLVFFFLSLPLSQSLSISLSLSLNLSLSLSISLSLYLSIYLSLSLSLSLSLPYALSLSQSCLFVLFPGLLETSVCASLVLSTLTCLLKAVQPLAS